MELTCSFRCLPQRCVGVWIKQVFPDFLELVKISGKLEREAWSYLHSTPVAVAEVRRMDQRALGCLIMGLFFSCSLIFSGHFPLMTHYSDCSLRQVITCSPASYILLRNQESGNIYIFFSVRPSALMLNCLYLEILKNSKEWKINIFRKFKGDLTTYLPLNESWHPEASLTAAPEGNHGLWRQTWAVSSATAINLKSPPLGLF